MKYKINISLVLSIMICMSFKMLAVTQSEEELIIGVWIPEGSPESKKVFSQDGKCYYYYKNIIEGTYSWSINYETTESGLIISDLQLVNVDNEEDIYNYMLEINNNVLTLVWSERPSNELIYTRDCTLDTDGDGLNDCEDLDNTVNNNTVATNTTKAIVYENADISITNLATVNLTTKDNKKKRLKVKRI